MATTSHHLMATTLRGHCDADRATGSWIFTGNEWVENWRRPGDVKTGWTVWLTQSGMQRSGWRDFRRAEAPESCAIATSMSDLAYYRPVRITVPSVPTLSGRDGVLLSEPDASRSCAVLIEYRVRIISAEDLEPHGKVLTREQLYDGSYVLLPGPELGK